MEELDQINRVNGGIGPNQITALAEFHITNRNRFKGGDSVVSYKILILLRISRWISPIISYICSIVSIYYCI